MADMTMSYEDWLEDNVKRLSGRKGKQAMDENNISKWNRVEDGLPENEKAVLASVVCGNGRATCKCMYIGKFTVESNEECEYEEYCEEKDEYFVEEGWYEIANFSEMHFAVSGKVTHWMEIPKFAD